MIAVFELLRSQAKLGVESWLGHRTLIALTHRHELFHFALKDREFGLNNVPDNVVRKSVVSVNQHVSEGDDPSVFGYSANCFQVASGKTVQGFPDDLELPFNCRSKVRIVSVGDQGLAARELRNETACLLNVEKMFLRLKLHTGGFSTVRCSLGSRGFGLRPVRRGLLAGRITTPGPREVRNSGRRGSRQLRDRIRRENPDRSPRRIAHPRLNRTAQAA